MIKQIIEEPIPLAPYFVEHNETGERAVCELIRGAWQRIEGTPLFFAYENNAVAVAAAHVCENCGEWALRPAGKYCENCVPW